MSVGSCWGWLDGSVTVFNWGIPQHSGGTDLRKRRREGAGVSSPFSSFDVGLIEALSARSVLPAVGGCASITSARSVHSSSLCGSCLGHRRAPDFSN